MIKAEVYFHYFIFCKEKEKNQYDRFTQIEIMPANWPQSEAIPRAFQVGSEGQPHHHNDHIRTESRASEVAKCAGPIRRIVVIYAFFKAAERQLPFAQIKMKPGFFSSGNRLFWRKLGNMHLAKEQTTPWKLWLCKLWSEMTFYNILIITRWPESPLFALPIVFVIVNAEFTRER